MGPGLQQNVLTLLSVYPTDTDDAGVIVIDPALSSHRSPHLLGRRANRVGVDAIARDDVATSNAMSPPIVRFSRTHTDERVGPAGRAPFPLQSGPSNNAAGGFVGP